MLFHCFQRQWIFPITKNLIKAKSASKVNLNWRLKRRILWRNFWKGLRYTDSRKTTKRWCLRWNKFKGGWRGTPVAIEICLSLLRGSFAKYSPSVLMKAFDDYWLLDRVAAFLLRNIAQLKIRFRILKVIFTVRYFAKHFTILPNYFFPIPCFFFNIGLSVPHRVGIAHTH